MPMDVKFENGSEGVGVSMPWNPRKRKEGEEGERDGTMIDEHTTLGELPLACRWMLAYARSVAAKEKAKQEHIEEAE